MPSILNGLSALGSGVASYAANAGAEAQKADVAAQLQQSGGQIAAQAASALAGTQSDLMTQKATLEQQQAVLADQLATQREATGRTQAAGIAATAASSEQAAQMARLQATINAPPETIKLLRALGQIPDPNATPPGPAPSGSGAAIPPSPSNGSAATTPAQGGAPGGGAAVSDNPLVRKALGYPQEGSEESTRYAIAQDVKSDPNFKYKTAGQQAAEVENRVAVAGGHMIDPTSRDALATSIAGYQEAPITGNGLTRPGAAEVMAAVLAKNPDYQASRFPEISSAMTAFGSGQEGNTIRSLNVGVQHLDLFDQAAKALASGWSPAFNAVKNEFQKQIGSPAPTTLDGLKQIVGTEIEKAVAGGVGATSDRDRLMEALNAANSPEQLQGISDAFRGLMIGQLNGFKTQYENSTGIKSGPFAFENKLAPATIKALGTGEASLTGTGAPSTSVPAAPKPPAIGEVQQGYTFTGGNPADPASWKAATPQPMQGSQ